MRADYDSESDTVGIELDLVDHLDWGETDTHNAAVVHFLGEQPVIVDLLGASIDVEEPLAAVAKRYELDLQALRAAARAALAAPDRVVVLDVGGRAAA
jgi:hypothetical protein